MVEECLYNFESDFQHPDFPAFLIAVKNPKFLSFPQKKKKIMKELGRKLVSFDISKFPQCQGFESYDER